MSKANGRPYRGPRSQRDLRSGRLDPPANGPRPSGSGPEVHRSAPSQDTHIPTSNGAKAPTRVHVPAGPGHFGRVNRRGVLIAAGVAGAAGAGGLVYDRKRRRARVSKLYNPFDGEMVDFGKAEEKPSRGRVATGALVPTYHGAVAGRKGRKVRAAGREYVESNGGALAGQLVGLRAGSRIKSVPGKVAAFVGGGMLGGAAGGAHAVYANQRKGYYKPEVRKTLAASASTGTGTRFVTPILPGGRHVSHENDLYEHHRTGQRRGSQSALALYRSGSQRRMTGGGQSYGSKARHVGKSLSTQQFAASVGRRGTPMSGIAQVGRVGHRLDVR